MSKEYSKLNDKLLKGWNTWDTRNVLSQVFMPEGFAISIEIRIDSTKIIGANLGKLEGIPAEITPGARDYDGSYTDLVIRYKDRNIRVQSASREKDIVMLVSIDIQDDSVVLSVIPEMKWNRNGSITRNGYAIRADVKDKRWTIYTTGSPIPETRENVKPQLSMILTGKLGVSTNKSLTVNEIEKLLAEAEKSHNLEIAGFGKDAPLYDAMQTVLAWNTIYDPINEMVITPVSRSWSGDGFILFEWDTYFAAYMLSMNNKDLAYANLIAITKEITHGGFVPNYASDKTKSIDRSEPPVGSMVLKEVYKHYRVRWILDLLFPDLLSWNRWWSQNRDYEGYLCWGSDPYLEPNASELDRRATGKMQGAKFESGLDDSPMYDNIPFDSTRHMMKLADVGLISLYIMDCNALADIAVILNQPAVENELHERANKYSKKLETLWDENEGIYLNKNLETGNPDKHKSPTLFYPLLAKVPSPERAGRMIKEHFCNTEEFWGDWIIPSVARNDPAFSNEYWRGRIWGPMNFLVYLGMRNYDVAGARNDLIVKSNKLLLKMWDKSRLVHENYNPFTGDGTSDDFYHWGALLGFMKFIEKGEIPGPEKPLK